MEFIYEDEKLAVSVIQAIHTGDIPTLEQQLTENPGLAKIRILERKPDNVDADSSISRTLLHVVTDWPGHFPHGADTVRVLIKFGAEVNAPLVGPNIEKPCIGLQAPMMFKCSMPFLMLVQTWKRLAR